MTRKRYIKLLYALMQEMNKEYRRMFGRTAPKCGRVLNGGASYEEVCEIVKQEMER